MPNITGASLTPIYERLSGADGYHPLSADTFGDWTMEAGDIVTVSRDDTDYESPVHSLQLTWKGSPKIQINSVGKEKRDPVSRQSARKYGRGGAAMRSQESMYSHFESEDGRLYSTIIQTASEISTEVAYTISNMSDTIARSVISQTATYIRTEVQNAASEIAESVIEQTAEQVMVMVSGVASGVAYTVVTQQMGGIEAQVIERSRVFVQLQDPQLTVSDLREGDIWIESAKKTWSELAGESWSEVSEGTWRGLYNSRHHVWHNNQWQLEYEAADIIEQGVDVNVTKEKFEVLAHQIDSQGQAYESNLTVTAQKIYSDVSVANRELYSTIAQTATSMHSEVVDLRNDTQSSITQTASAIMTSVSASNSTLYSTIEQTATYIMTTVSNTTSGLQSQITQQANKISLVVDSNNHIKAAQIVAAINDEGSSVLISADHIVLDGDAVATSLTGKSVGAYFLGCDDLQVTGEMQIDDSVTLVPEYGSRMDFMDLLASATVSGNTLTIKNIRGETVVNFSKAASLTGSWSGGSSFPLTVSAGLNNTYTVGFSSSYSTYDTQLELTTNGGATVSTIPYSVTVPLKIQEIMSGQQSPESRYTKNLDVSISTLLQAKSTGSNGTVTPDTGYIGLKNVTVSVSPTWGTSGFVDNTNNLPSGTKHQVNSLKTSIVSNRSRQGYIYFTIAIAGTTHVYYFTDNGDGWTT